MANDKTTYCKETDMTEFHAFLGLMYFRAALNVNKSCREVIWYHESANDVFGATMSLKRFAFLLLMLCFDEKSNEIVTVKTR